MYIYIYISFKGVCNFLKVSLAKHSSLPWPSTPRRSAQEAFSAIALANFCCALLSMHSFLFICTFACLAVPSWIFAAAQVICPDDLASYVNQVSSISLVILESFDFELIVPGCQQQLQASSRLSLRHYCKIKSSPSALFHQSSRQVQVLNGSDWLTLLSFNDLQFFSPASNTKVA